MKCGANIADVCVIGGGPAGSTVACRLAAFGYRVCLLEREAVPEARSGASLPSSILPLLDVIGVRQQLEAACFLRPERIVVWWADARPSVRSLPGLPGFHVDRRRFDDMLLRHAEAHGVMVLRSADAMRPQRRHGDGWQIPVRHDGQRKDVEARFLVDAAGSRGVLPGRRIRGSAPLLSLFAHWHAPDSTQVEGCVEAGDNEWLWYAPLGGGTSVAAIFIDPKRLSGMSRANIEAVYFELLRRFRFFRAEEAGRIASKVTACDASSRHAEHAAGSDFVRVGDANLTLDPLSAQGIQTAVASALQAAVVINTLAKHPAHAEDAIAFYSDRQTEKVLQHATRAAEFYRERAAISGQPFWTQRAVAAIGDVAPAPELETRRLEPSCRVELSRLSRIEPMPVMQGDIIASAPALRHAALDRPVAFLNEVELVPLLRRIHSGETAGAVVHAWSDRMSPDLGWNMLQWLWHRRIVVPVSGF
jgi:flavin-dependent dehydrogenase